MTCWNEKGFNRAWKVIIVAVSNVRSSEKNKMCLSWIIHNRIYQKSLKEKFETTSPIPHSLYF